MTITENKKTYQKDEFEQRVWAIILLSNNEINYLPLSLLCHT